MQSNASEIARAPITIGRKVRVVGKGGERENPQTTPCKARPVEKLEINPMQSDASEIACARHHVSAKRRSTAPQ